MATITPNSNPSQALITPGWPMVSVARSNPVAAQEAVQPPTQVPVLQTALKASGNNGNRIL